MSQQEQMSPQEHNDSAGRLDSTISIDSAEQPHGSIKQPKAPSGPDELLEALGCTVSPELLVHALTHRSFANEHHGLPNNERLEFLGDAVLELVSTETLFKTHPDMNEGQLAKMRAKAVSEEALSAIARTKLKLGPYILLGVGESTSGGADKSSILCDTVEALIGAVFVEHGIEGGRKVVHRLVDDTLAEVATEGPALDWKTSLTVKAHHMDLGEPHYRMKVSGPEFQQTFTAEVMLGDSTEILAQATGSSKRKAQLAAAEVAWKLLDAKKHEQPSLS
ncbi:MAG: ribonuclease III [Bifidobacterium aquikefiri]|uniref:Ribonuclease 3 n=1 Tax=Bifidobacterium aquikefiri TaxID=1653207 RepID=A0A261G3Q5_9BIFI|nr:ribonuclease III [Bifidobacterium aquikefiri]OZG66049.1 ribonuclease III [Bifidobacterium aquikefiri]